MGEHKRLSQSGLWAKNLDYFHQQGVKAWSTGSVPFGATSNPVLARACADLFLAYLEDLLSVEALNLDQPIFVVELGAGAGRFGYLVLRRLEELRDEFPLDVRYVLTDYAQTNLEFWREHERLKPFLQSGALELARFDAESDSSIVLESSGKKLDGADNPIFFLANYLFCTLSMDAFRCRGGVLEEALVKGDAEDGSGLALEYCLAEEAPYGRPEYDQALAEYRRRLSQTSFLFPIGPLTCLRTLSQLSKGRMCLVTADKGWSLLEEVVGRNECVPYGHGGSFSFDLNFHALRTAWEQNGGKTLISGSGESDLKVAVFSSGFEHRLVRLERTFRDRVVRYGPQASRRLTSFLASDEVSKDVRVCLDLLQASDWEPELLYKLASPLTSAVAGSSVAEMREVHTALSRVWRNYFPIGESEDLPFEIARILFHMQYFEQALEFYGESIRMHGEHKMTRQQIGLCHYFMRQLEPARKSFEAALSLDPDYQEARKSLVLLEPELEESGSFLAVTPHRSE